jgi:hypothetical protein
LRVNESQAQFELKGKSMNTLRLVSIAAALGLASAAYAQNQSQDQTTSPSSSQQQSTESSDPSAASSPHQQETTRGTTHGEKTPAPPSGQTGTSSADPSAASSPHQKEATGEKGDSRMSSANTGAGATTGGEPQVIGLEVITPAGEPLGAVVDVVMDSSGAPAYAVITSAGKATAVPYSTASAMVHDNAIVMDQSKLQGTRSRADPGVGPACRATARRSAPSHPLLWRVRLYGRGVSSRPSHHEGSPPWQTGSAE